MLDFHTLLAYIEPQAGVNAHVLVCHPDQGKTADQIAAPIIIKQLVARDDQEKDRDVVAETVFAGKKKEELACKKRGIFFALAQAVLTWLT